MKQIRRENREERQKREYAKLVEIHTNPPIPDGVGKYGDLPYLKCAWTRCGKVFSNRDQLLQHVAYYENGNFSHRFHLHCASVLGSNPQMSRQEFMERIKAKSRRHKEVCITAYYDQMQPIFSGK